MQRRRAEDPARDRRRLVREQYARELGAVKRDDVDGELIVQPPRLAPRRSDDYLAFVRRHPCCLCLTTYEPRDAHHFRPRGIGQKTDDRRTVPLCRRCHDDVHAYREAGGVHPSQHHVHIHAAMVDLLIEWMDTAPT